MSSGSDQEWQSLGEILWIRNYDRHVVVTRHQNGLTLQYSTIFSFCTLWSTLCCLLPCILTVYAIILVLLFSKLTIILATSITAAIILLIPFIYYFSSYAATKQMTLDSAGFHYQLMYKSRSVYQKDIALEQIRHFCHQTQASGEGTGTGVSYLCLVAPDFEIYSFRFNVRKDQPGGQYGRRLVEFQWPEEAQATACALQEFVVELKQNQMEEQNAITSVETNQNQNNQVQDNQQDSRAEDEIKPNQ